MYYFLTLTDFVRVKLYYGTVAMGNVIKLRIANRRSFATEYHFVILERSEESIKGIPLKNDGRLDCFNEIIIKGKTAI